MDNARLWNKVASDGGFMDSVFSLLGGLKQVTQTTGLKRVEKSTNSVKLYFPINNGYPNEVEIKWAGGAFVLTFTETQKGLPLKVRASASELKEVLEDNLNLYLSRK